MKRVINGIILTILLSIPAVSADEKKWFTGVDISVADVDFTSSSSKGTENSKILKLKIGAKLEKNLRVLTYMKISKLDNQSIYGAGIDLVKSLFIQPSFSPYLKLGIGLDSMNPPFSDERIYGGAISFGLGSYIPIDKNFELVFGYDYQMRLWQNFTTTSQEGETLKDNMHKLTLGVNYLF